ncbi:hypothetical protein KSF73_08135 [Burkholderiaceae bacterium DAT-1]|nr:hypothetical protein [Burkholderiaceae bacterium DAT-1]
MLHQILLAALTGLAVAAGTAPADDFSSTLISRYSAPQLSNPSNWLTDSDAVAFRQWQATHADDAAALRTFPGYLDLQTRLNDVSASLSHTQGVQRAGTFFFALKTLPGAAGQSLSVRDGLAGKDTVLASPGTLGDATLVQYAAADNGQHIALTLRIADRWVLRVIDNRGRTVGDDIAIRDATRVQWLPNDLDLVYSPADHGKAAAMIHRMGQSSSRDRVILPVDLLPWFGQSNERNRLLTADDSQHVIFEHCNAGRCIYLSTSRNDLESGSVSWKTLVHPSDQAYSAVLNRDGLYVFTREDAPRGKVVNIAASGGSLSQGRVVIPEPADGMLIEGVAASEGMYVRVAGAQQDKLLRMGWPAVVREKARGGKSTVSKGKKSGKTSAARGSGKSSSKASRKSSGRSASKSARHSRGSSRSGQRDAARLSGVHEIALSAPRLTAMIAGTDREGIMVQLESQVTAPKLYVLDSRGNAFDTRLIMDSVPDYSAYMEESIRFKGDKGQSLTLNLLRPKSFQRSGDHPTLLSGGSPAEARFQALNVVWLEQNGIVATCSNDTAGRNEAARAADLLGCARYLVEHGFTRPDRLSAHGMASPLFYPAYDTADLIAYLLWRMEMPGFSEGIAGTSARN